MRLLLQQIGSLIVFLTYCVCVSAQDIIAISGDTMQTAIPLLVVDSIKAQRPKQFCILTKDSTLLADSIFFNRSLPDTLVIDYRREKVYVKNPSITHFQVSVLKGDVFVSTRYKGPFACLATGTSNDGRLVIDNDTTCTLVLDNLELTSQKGSAIYFKQKQKAVIELHEGTKNRLTDASAYQTDSTDTSNSCLYSKGSLTFTGNGSLTATGRYRHGIASSKNIKIDKGHLIIKNVAKHGIHCDKFTMEGGRIELNLANDASKGIKAKKEICIKNGQIDGKATGSITIDSVDTSYCSLLKSDGSMLIKDGEVNLTHEGKGGRCISVDNNLTIEGGRLHLECRGDGGSYLTTANDSDYYTPKCITADDTITIKDGTIDCKSTGLGGKGIVAGNCLAIGDSVDLGNMSFPAISIETQGECIFNNVDEDLRFGCPKGIKSDSLLVVYSGNISVTTAGMGGEGVECNGQMFIRGGTLVCNTFDDGINVADSIEISGGLVYCNSADNDGIDSNGSICISGGIVASVNQSKPNESFDAEKGQIYLLGGTVFGIGSGDVKIKETTIPCYSTPFIESNKGVVSRGLILTEGKYVYIQRDEDIIMALRNDNKAFRSFLTVMSPAFSDSEQLSVYQGDCPFNTQQSFFGNRLVFGGIPNNSFLITDIQVQIIK